MAARASRRSASEPPKCASSVRIDSAAAPPRSYARDDLGAARALADRRPPTASGACARRSATCRGATAPRRTGGPRARSRPARSSSASGCSRWRRSSGVARGVDDARPGAGHAAVAPTQRSEHARGGAVVDRASPRRRTPVGERVGAARHVDRGAGVQDRRASARCRRSPASTSRSDRARSGPACRRPPRRRPARSSPTLLGRHRRSCVSRPSLSSTTRVAPETEISSRPSALDTTRARSAAKLAERRRHASRAWPGRRRRSPGACAPAGFVSGPRKLKIVRTAELLAHRHDVARRRVVRGREHEAEADLVDARRRPRRASRSMRAPSASSTSADPHWLGRRAVAVLGHAAARARGDEGRGGRDVEGRPPAAGARGVDAGRRRHRPAPRSSRIVRGQPGDLVDRLALRAQRDQEAGGLRLATRRPP